MLGYDARPHIGHPVRLCGPDPLLGPRGPLTSAAWRVDFELLPAEEASRRLRRELLAVEQVAPAGAVRAAAGARRRVPAALRQQRVRHRLERLDLADHAVAAALRSGAAAAAADRVAHDAQRE